MKEKTSNLLDMDIISIQDNPNPPNFWLKYDNVLECGIYDNCVTYANMTVMEKLTTEQVLEVSDEVHAIDCEQFVYSGALMLDQYAKFLEKLFYEKFGNDKNIAD